MGAYLKVLLCLLMTFSSFSYSQEEDEEDEGDEIDFSSPFDSFQTQEVADDGVPRPYRLNMGDELLISVYGDFSTQRSVKIDTTGHISYLFLDRVPAIGKTIPEVRKLLVEGLESFYREPVVTITPLGFTNNAYTILGEVNFPGTKSIIGNATILSAIANAGGFTTRVFREQTIDQAELSQSFLARDGEYVPVDFVQLVEMGDTSQDLRLKDGDFIFIKTSRAREVYILGEVNQPLTIRFYNQLTLLEAITYAAGTTLKASSRIAIIRGSLCHPVRYLVDYNRIKKAKACDFFLEPGDIVYVPPQKFFSLKEIFRTTASAFISNMASIAGTNAYISIQPAALGSVTSPVPVINASTGPASSILAPAGG